jgi:TetR/AcrR family transcriptional regulator, transcriptional repressor for nem operon
MEHGRMSEIAPKTAFAAASPDSRTRLLNAAIDVIRTRGYSATRVEDICAAAGLTKGSFFAGHWNASTGALFRTAPFQAAPDPLDRLLAYIDFRRALLAGRSLPEFTCLMGTMAQELYETHPDLRDACERGIASHAATLEADIAAAMKRYGIRGEWTAQSLALHTQAVIQGAFILAKAGQAPQRVADSLDHLRRYITLLFAPPGA